MHDPERVRRLVCAAVWSGLSGEVCGSDGVRLDVYAVRLVGDFERIRWRARKLPRGPLRFILRSTYSEVRFRTRPGESAELGFTTPVPTHVERVRTPEMGPRPGDRVAVRALGSTGSPVEYPVGQVTVEGVEVLGALPDRHVFAGQRLAATLIGGCVDGVRLTGMVRVAGFGQSGKLRVLLGPDSAAERAIWLARLGVRLRERIATAGAPPDQSWALFERCGYFSLSGTDAAEFLPLKQAHEEVVHTFAENGAIGVHATWSYDGMVRGTLAAARMTQGAWFGLHLAKDRGDFGAVRGPTILWDMHRRVYEHITLQRGARWMVGLFQRNGSWSNYAHAAFPQRYTAAGVAEGVPVDVWQLPAVPGRPAETASAVDTPQVIEGLQAQLSPIFCAAYDLVPGQLHLESISTLYRRAGLTRLRECLVAREGGRIVACALCTHTSPGVHVYRLMDVCWLFELHPGGAAHFNQLLAGAGDWYTRQGTDQFMYLQPLDRQFEPPHGRSLATADLTFVSVEILPDLAEHIWEITARRRIVR